MAQEASFIKRQIQAQQAFEILSRKTGGLESDAFIHSGIIADVNDPEKRGRVKVIYGADEASRSVARDRLEDASVLHVGFNVLGAQLISR